MCPASSVGSGTVGLFIINCYCQENAREPLSSKGATHRETDVWRWGRKHGLSCIERAGGLRWPYCILGMLVVRWMDARGSSRFPPQQGAAAAQCRVGTVPPPSARKQRRFSHSIDSPYHALPLSARSVAAKRAHDAWRGRVVWRLWGKPEPGEIWQAIAVSRLQPCRRRKSCCCKQNDNDDDTTAKKPRRSNDGTVPRTGRSERTARLWPRRPSPFASEPRTRFSSGRPSSTAASRSCCSRSSRAGAW